jgi:hypothetical protein
MALPRAALTDKEMVTLSIDTWLSTPTAYSDRNRSTS